MDVHMYFTIVPLHLGIYDPSSQREDSTNIL